MNDSPPRTRDTTRRITGWLLRHSLLRFFLYAFVIAALVALSWPFIMNAVIVASSDEQQERIKVAGTLGDLFGALTALVSFLTLGMAFLAAYFQREQLLDERQAREDEHREQHFFSLLELINAIVAGIEVADYANPVTRDQIRDFAGRRALIRLSEMAIAEQRREQPTPASLDRVRQAWKRAYRDRNFHTVLGHYFRVLDRLLVWIETCPEPQRRVYAKTLRAQLSSHELVLIFYHCLSEEGAEMKPRIERLHLLKHLTAGELAAPSQHGLLPSGAYDDEDEE